MKRKMDRYLTGKRKKTGDARQWNMAVKSNKKEEAYLALKFTVNVEQKFKLRFSCTTETCFFFLLKNNWFTRRGHGWSEKAYIGFGHHWKTSENNGLIQFSSKNAKDLLVPAPWTWEYAAFLCFISLYILNIWLLVRQIKQLEEVILGSG